MNRDSEGKQDGRSDGTRRGGGTENGLQEILSHAQGEIRTNLLDAIEKEQQTGQKLIDILRQDVDRDMFKSIWKFLNRPIVGKNEEQGGKKVKDQLFEGGWIAPDELEAAERTGEAYDAKIGHHLISRGHISEAQLQDALAQQDRTGQSFWRVLVNQGLVSPKQIADARKYGEKPQVSALGTEALKKICLRTGMVTEEDWEAALKQSGRSGRHILQVLVDSEVAGKEELGKAISAQLGIEWVDLADAGIDPEALKLLPEHLARASRMIPISRTDDTVRVAMANPQDAADRESFHILVDMDMEPVLAFEQDILDAIERHYRPVGTAKPEGGEDEGGALGRLKSRLGRATRKEQEVVSLAENAGVISMVASIIEGAVNSRATDIHLEPQAESLRVRYRMDGLLYDIMNLPGYLSEEVISRVKVLADLDIAERRRPQDGHFTIEVHEGEREYDIRVSTLPTVLGEKMALRLLNPEDLFRGLRELGLDPEQLAGVERAIDEPYGMIMSTGPIGSGKTTTLYALLSEVDILTQNVVTIEDPVEYQLPGINQVQVDRRIERTFAGMLRSVVRQDANVMMVGEVRDAETANVAVEAAGTGHLLLCTMHTNDTAGAITRLGNLGVPSFLVANSVTTIIAQRLVRRICQSCREEYDPEEAILNAVGLSGDEAGRITFYRGGGCDECFQTGYRGRTGIFEVLQLSPAIRQIVLAGADRTAVVARAREEGMTTLREAGIKKIEQGVTTLEEVARVKGTASRHARVEDNIKAEGEGNA